MRKVGADDFLADYGTWSDLLAQVTPGLPAQPKRQDFDKVGEYRFGGDGTVLERCEEDRDENGEVVRGLWRPVKPVMPIGGRVVAQTVKRRPSAEENRTGRFAADLGRIPVEDERVEIEVSWKGPDGDTITEVVEGPSDLLVETPDRWHTHSQVSIPASLKLHPKWPPRGQVGQDWVSAVKANRANEIQYRTLWTRMGWVPVPGDVPVFAVGNQVVGERVEGTTQSAVGELLHNADLFGVGDDDGATWEDEDYRVSVAADLRTTIDAVMTAYGDASAAAVTLAAGVRAVVPMRSPSVVYLVGPPGSGKSYTAGAISGFWARRPGVWDGNALPGSAKDSVAATEASLSVSCFWVIDDLAPSADANKQRGEQANMDDVIRMVFNGASRGRMTKDGTPRPARIPNAMLVATAENESTVESIRQRSLALWFRKGSLARVPGRHRRAAAAVRARRRAGARHAGPHQVRPQRGSEHPWWRLGSADRLDRGVGLQEPVQVDDGRRHAGGRPGDGQHPRRRHRSRPDAVPVLPRRHGDRPGSRPALHRPAD